VSHEWDIAIVGGGAAGLAAAIFAAGRRPSARVALLDGVARLGAKILVSGGGRCNVTHERVTPEDFNASRVFVRHVLAAFDEARTVRWFESLGVRLKREPTGKLFPVTDRARDVLEALLARCQSLGVAILTSHRVHEIVPGAGAGTGAATGSFHIHHDRGVVIARRVILATGGCSLPRTGSDGEGWGIARSLGHTVTPTYPALVPLVLDPSMFHGELSGVSVEVGLSTFTEGKRIDRRIGSLLWTHFGISGPVVMDASRHWVVAHAQGGHPKLVCSFTPGQEFGEVEKEVVSQAAAQPKRTVAGALEKWVPQRLAQVLLRWGGLDPATPLAQLAREDRRRVVHQLTALDLPVLRDRGWNYAEVTAGGVPLGEVDHRTMASRRVAGLYLIGEMLDCDGRIGGFNFQWAWSTGHVAGRAAADSFQGDQRLSCADHAESL
jgi:hypothetical protein